MKNTEQKFWKNFPIEFKKSLQLILDGWARYYSRQVDMRDDLNCKDAHQTFTTCSFPCYIVCLCYLSSVGKESHDSASHIEQKIRLKDSRPSCKIRSILRSKPPKVQTLTGQLTLNAVSFTVRRSGLVPAFVDALKYRYHQLSLIQKP